jgi:hypothetical protein
VGRESKTLPQKSNNLLNYLLNNRAWLVIAILITITGFSVWGIINNTKNVNGVSSGTSLPISKGGTDATNASDALKNLLPDLTGNDGKILGLNGGTPTWINGAQNLELAVYLDANSGNDSTGDGTEGNPWKTFKHAIDWILAHKSTSSDVRINLKAGDYNTGQDEPLLLSRFGRLIINGAGVAATTITGTLYFSTITYLSVTDITHKITTANVAALAANGAAFFSEGNGVTFMRLYTFDGQGLLGASQRAITLSAGLSQLQSIVINNTPVGVYAYGATSNVTNYTRSNVTTALQVSSGSIVTINNTISAGGTQGAVVSDASSVVLVGGDQKYSTAETFTGRWWTDGKPIYRRVFEGNIVAAASTSINTNIFTSATPIFDALVAYGGYWLPGTASRTSVSYISEYSNSGMFLTDATVTFASKAVNARTGTTNNAYKIWVEYTKL